MQPLPAIWPIAESHLAFVRSLPTAERPAVPPIKPMASSWGTARRKGGSGLVAVVPVWGVLTQHADPWWPGVSCDEIAAWLDAALASPADSVVLDVDSPGGSVYGVQELGDKIYNARKIKPILAVANSMACSAAYWLGASASRFYCTPGGDVGSVGVYSVHADYSEQLKAEGVKVTVTKAGRYKAELGPYEPLTQDARDALQQSVDECYRQFVRAVARGRAVPAGHVMTEFGQGRSVSAARARSAKMIDDTATLDQVLQMALNPSVRPPTSTITRADVPTSSKTTLQLRWEHEKRKTADWLAGRSLARPIA